MKYPYENSNITGILVPLTGLRSASAVGCGEFADLVTLGSWCGERGIRLIQLLPVNDTGGQSSPYSALSANALHPVYVRLQDLPEYSALPQAERKKIDTEIEEARKNYEPAGRFDYPAVLKTKQDLLRRIFDAAGVLKASTETLGSFTRKNGWVKAYAVYRALKRQNDERPWLAWEAERDIDDAGIERLWKRKNLTAETRFYVWMQMRLAEQFSAAAQALDAIGIALKGDIPILINEDSADAWADRDVFRPELRAGAPPDMFSELGQNWGFPIYNWMVLRERDYDWWRRRLDVASRYYHAYRIDHVLGFFRIWSVPAGNFSGIPGFFWPQHGISRDELYEIGFDDGRIRWLQEPHIPEGLLVEELGRETLDLLTGETGILQRLDDEELFLFSPDVTGEQQLAELNLPDPAKERLLEHYRDRALTELPDGKLASTWTFRQCSRYTSLTDGERERFEGIVARTAVNSNELWADHGRTVLKVMKESSDMLPCAEDLGVVPEAVPRVLQSLGILGLKIPRWTHYWDQPGEPLVPFHEYPELSVCAPSVHDTSTIRGWWEKETGRDELWTMLGGDTPAPETFDPSVAREVYRAILKSPSRIVVFALQDLLALSPEIIHDDPDLERVNIPGTYNDFNWTWRMPLTLEELQLNSTLNAEVSALTTIRKALHRRNHE